MEPIQIQGLSNEMKNKTINKHFAVSGQLLHNTYCFKFAYGSDRDNINYQYLEKQKNWMLISPGCSECVSLVHQSKYLFHDYPSKLLIEDQAPS